MNSIRITTSQNIELEYELASLGDRILGRILDGLILGAYAIIFIIVFLWNGLIGENFWILLIFALPIIFYDLACEVFMNGQSVGKRIMDIKVISLDGGQPTLGQYLIRWVFRLIDFSLTSSLCALITVAISEKKQRVGDMVAGTTLIKTIVRTALHQTLYVPTEQVAYTVRFPEVTNLSDQDMQLIKEVLNTVKRTGNSMLAYEASVKIKETLGVESELEPMQFLQVVLSDYNYTTSKL
jgi:uncharacterized RDD family membrane protein YckC